PTRQSDPDCAAEGRCTGLRAGVRARQGSARRRRPALHLPRRHDLARRRARRVQVRRDAAAAIEPGAGGADRAAEPVGLVLLARGRRGDDEAVPARRLQPRRPGRRRAGRGGCRHARRVARPGRAAARVLTAAARAGYTDPVVNPGSACTAAAWPIRSYSEMTWAPNSSSVAPISRLSRTTIAVVSEPYTMVTCDSVAKYHTS